MTVQEAILDAYEGSNEQDDLSPYVAGAFSIAAEGAQRLLGAFRRGARALSVWRFADNRSVRIPALEAEEVVATSFLEGTSPQATWPAQTVAIDPAHAAEAANGGFVGRLFTLEGATYLITASAGGAAPSVTLSSEIAAAPTDYSYSIARRDYPIAEGGSPWALAHAPVIVTGLYDIEGNAELEKAHDRERYRSASFDAGTPSAFVRVQGGVRLNVFPDEARMYILQYWRFVEVGEAAGDEICELPAQYHEPLVAWVKNWALSRDGDFTAAQKAWAMLIALMSSIRSPEDVGADYDEQIMRIVK